MVYFPAEHILTTDSQQMSQKRIMQCLNGCWQIFFSHPRPLQYWNSAVDRATWIYVCIWNFRINEDFLLWELGNVMAAKYIQGQSSLGLDTVCFSTSPRTAQRWFLVTSVLPRCVELCTRHRGDRNIPLCFQNGKWQNLSYVTVIWKQKALLEVQRVIVLLPSEVSEA